MIAPMSPRFETAREKMLAGLRETMSLANNKTERLWKSFMPRRKEISNALNTNLISLQVYTSVYFTDFSPENTFEKWATIEVTDFNNTPHGMETYMLKSGLYAVFKYQGLSGAHSIFEYIFGTWLPTSDYMLDNRPHFEILGEKYRNNDPDSEEEIWIPVKRKERT